MITTSSKWFFGLGLFSLVLAAAYGWTTGGDGLGPVTAGYKGGVGDHLGYGVLLAVAAIAFLLGVSAVVTRDADAEALAQLVGADAPPPALPTADAYWPVIGAFGAAVAAIGLVVSNVLFIAGLIACAIALLEWAVLAWSDRATGDPATNRALRNRIMAPFEVPLAGALAIAVLVVAVSRLFLTSSELGAVWIAVAVAVIVLGLGALFATRPTLSSNIVAAVLVLGALAVVTGGVIAGARGEREYHSLTEEGEHAEEDDDDRPRVRIPGATGIGEPATDVEPPSTDPSEEGEG